MQDKPIGIVMKRIFVYVLLSASSLLFMASCFDAKDFEFDELSTDDIGTTLHLPLFKDSLYLKETGESLHVKYLEDGTAALFFAVPTLTLPDMSSLLTIPPATLTLTSGSVTHSGGIALPPIPLPVSVPFVMPGGERLDSISVQNMSLTINNTGNFETSFKVEIPGFSPTTITAPAGQSSSATFSGMLRLAGNNFSATVTISSGTLSAGTYNYGGSLEFNVPSNALRAYGYFGQKDIPADAEVDNIGEFDKIKGNCSIDGAYLDLAVTNYTGIPVRLSLTEVRAGTTTVSNAGNIPIAAAPSTVTGKLTKGQLGGSMLGPVIDKLIKGETRNVGFSFVSSINPDGPSTLTNYINSASNPFGVSAEVVVPLKLSAAGLQVRDTMAMGFPDNYTFNSLGAKVNVVNNMPVEVKLQGVLLDADDHPVKDGPNEVKLFPGEGLIIAAPDVFEGKVVTPKSSTLDVALDAVTIQKLKEAKKVAISLTVNTSNAGAEKVMITKDNYVKVQVGVQAGMNFDDIKDEL